MDSIRLRLPDCAGAAYSAYDMASPVHLTNLNLRYGDCKGDFVRAPECMTGRNVVAKKVVKRVQRGKAPKSAELRAIVCERFRAAVYCYAEKQVYVANALGITAQQLSKSMTGTSYPDEQVIVDFCDLSGFSLDWIYRGRAHSIVPRDMAMRLSELYPDLLPDHDAMKLAEVRAAIDAGSDAARRAVEAERARVAEAKRARRADAMSTRVARVVKVKRKKSC